MVKYLCYVKEGVLLNDSVPGNISNVKGLKLNYFDLVAWKWKMLLSWKYQIRRVCWLLCAEAFIKKWKSLFFFRPAHTEWCLGFSFVFLHKEPGRSSQRLIHVRNDLNTAVRHNDGIQTCSFALVSSSRKNAKAEVRDATNSQVLLRSKATKKLCMLVVLLCCTVWISSKGLILPESSNPAISI